MNRRTIDRVDQHVANPGAGQPHPVLRGLPHLGLLDPGADDQTDQRRDDGQAEQPPPRQVEPIDDHQRRHGRQQIAERVARLQQTREEPAPFDGDLLHRQRSTQPPLAAHADAVQQAQHDEHREVGCERAEEPDGRIEDHVDDQRDAPAHPVGPEAEQQRAHRPHEQGGGGEEGDLGGGDVERLGDVGVDEDHDEVVEGVHRPAELRGDEGVALVGRQGCGRHVT